MKIEEARGQLLPLIDERRELELAEKHSLSHIHHWKQTVRCTGGRWPLVARCAGFKPDGTPCERIVGASQSYCYAHDPSCREERRRNAARAGKSRPNKEVAALKDQLAKLADDTLAGRLDKGVAVAVVQIANARVRLLEAERRIREQGDLEQRI